MVMYYVFMLAGLVVMFASSMTIAGVNMLETCSVYDLIEMNLIKTNGMMGMILGLVFVDVAARIKANHLFEERISRLELELNKLKDDDES